MNILHEKQNMCGLDIPVIIIPEIELICILTINSLKILTRIQALGVKMRNLIAFYIINGVIAQ